MDVEQASIAIEVVYALPDQQHVIALRVPRGTCTAMAIRLSGIAARHPEIETVEIRVGIYGRVVTPETVMQDGDRVEIYRPLLADPKQARRRRASRQA